MDRFERQTKLRGFGITGQERLRNSSVLIVGAGGLGCPALLYLSAMGIGRIGIADGDTVDVSNLSRQVLYGESDKGQKKVFSVKRNIESKYSDIQVEVFPEYLSNSNALDLISRYDVVIDGTDNFSVRYMINDACNILNKPYVYGAIYEYEGQVSIFNVDPGEESSIQYRDLFPTPPDPTKIPTCEESGVLGILPGIIGNIQAAETIKYLSGIGSLLYGKLLCYNLLTQQFYEMNITRRGCSQLLVPHNREEFLNYDYSFSCMNENVVDWDTAREIKNLHPDLSVFVDVREADELPKIENLSLFSLPLSSIYQKMQNLNQSKNILVFCQSGVRSRKAVSILKRQFPEKNIYSIEGGLMNQHSVLNN